MDRLIDDNREALAAACERFGVQSLEVFGSAATGALTQGSDIDLLVRFDPEAPTTGLRQFFGFKEAVEALLGRPVDLASPDALRTPASGPASGRPGSRSMPPDPRQSNSVGASGGSYGRAVTAWTCSVVSSAA